MAEHRDVAIVVPVLGRPHQIRPLYENIAAVTPGAHEVHFAASAGDEEVLEEIHRLARDPDARCVLHTSRPVKVGDYARKINAVYRATVAPFIFLGAGDLAFRPGWAEAALAAMDDPTIGVVGTQDLAPTERARSGEHSTHCLVRRRYADELGLIDQPGAILCELYWHEYVDDELVGTAKVRHAWRFAADSIVEHLHPSWGKAQFDPMYRRQRRRMMYGRPIFQERKQLWAPTLSP